MISIQHESTLQCAFRSISAPQELTSLTRDYCHLSAVQLEQRRGVNYLYSYPNHNNPYMFEMSLIYCERATFSPIPRLPLLERNTLRNCLCFSFIFNPAWEVFESMAIMNGIQVPILYATGRMNGPYLCIWDDIYQYILYLGLSYVILQVFTTFLSLRPEGTAPITLGELGNGRISDQLSHQFNLERLQREVQE
jgi:hypothetical protein